MHAAFSLCFTLPGSLLVASLGGKSYQPACPQYFGDFLHILLLFMYHISVVRNLCSFSTSNALVFAFLQFACVCMFVCVLYRTAVRISNTCGYKNLRANIFLLCSM